MNLSPNSEVGDARIGDHLANLGGTRADQGEAKKTIKQGFLFKQSEHKYKLWQRRWVTLTDDHELYYRHDSSSPKYKKMGLIHVVVVRGVDKYKSSGHPFVFELVTKSNHSLKFSCPSDNEKNEWVKLLEKSLLLEYEKEAKKKDFLLEKQFHSLTMKILEKYPEEEVCKLFFQRMMKHWKLANHQTSDFYNKIKPILVDFTEEKKRNSIMSANSHSLSQGSQGKENEICVGDDRTDLVPCLADSAYLL